MMIFKKIKKNKGFVILFAVTLSAIFLAIALGVTNIALKEVKFGTSARSTNDAFFAADTGIECAFFNDKSTSNIFVQGGESKISCFGYNIEVFGAFPSWDFVVYELGSMGQSCAKVSVFKDDSESPYIKTTITAKGYDIGDSSCNSTNPDRIERQIEARY